MTGAASITATEAAKYRAMWGVPEYADNSPGKLMAPIFMEVSGARAGERVWDIGCGDGQGGRELQTFGLIVSGMDLVDANPGYSMVEQPIWTPLPSVADYSFCCDVLEHVPREFTMLAVRNVVDACSIGAFFSISTVPDMMGRLIKETLHLTVERYVWWRDHLKEFGEIVEARDLLNCGVFYVRR
jgi:2-polyprenyl-3-methyl-5-hydroxy-6-metoxy-1,4-benzoquinol methylase